MADSHDSDWWRSLTASERYDNIQKLTKAVAAAGLTQSAFMLESEAFKTSNSREEYDSACALSFDAEQPGLLATADEPSYSPAGNDDDTDEDPGTRIGPYQNCHYVASGVTAEVYRCKDRALKVIVETRDIEPHNPFREAKILGLLSRPCVPLLETFRDQEQRFVLVFPYMPLTLSYLLENHGPSNPLPDSQIHPIFTALFQALQHIHSQGIIHRDIKPSAILLSSSTPATITTKPPPTIYLSDFGTAWHPTLSTTTEPPTSKILDIGTGPYRAPEVLFGNKAYTTAVDMWTAGVMLAECCSGRPPFESRPVHEDGNQLGLILSIFKTIGSPTRETWPEALGFKTPPFEMYRAFEGRGWDEVLAGVGEGWRGLVVRLVRYESGERGTAEEALDYITLNMAEESGGTESLQ